MINHGHMIIRLPENTPKSSTADLMKSAAMLGEGLGARTPGQPSEAESDPLPQSVASRKTEISAL